MKEKIKKFFSKDNLFILICTLLIALFVFLSVIYHKKDVENYENKNSSDINLCENDLLDVYLSDSSFTHNNNLSFIPLNYYEEISMEDFAFDYGILAEGYCNVGAFYISNRDLFYTIRNAFYLDDTQPNIFLNFSLDYHIDLIDNDFSFNVPLWVNYDADFLSRSELIDYLESNGAPYSSSTTFTDNSSLQTTINFSIDITEYIRQYSNFQNNTQFPEKKIVFYILTRFADARYDSSDCTTNIGLVYYNYNFASSAYTVNNGYTSNYYCSFEPNTNYTFKSYNQTDSTNYSVKIKDYNNNFIQIISPDGSYRTHNNDGFSFITNSSVNGDLILEIRTSVPITNFGFYMLSESSYFVPYQPYYNSFSFTDWCSFKSFSVSNFSNDSYLAYDTLNSRYNTLLNDYNDLNNQYVQIESNYSSLNSNYNSLLQQYNSLANNEYTFSELFWSISAVPFGVLASGFNVNVLGVNLAAIITGLFTALLIIWIIKKFLK